MIGAHLDRSSDRIGLGLRYRRAEWRFFQSPKTDELTGVGQLVHDKRSGDSPLPFSHPWLRMPPCCRFAQAVLTYGQLVRDPRGVESLLSYRNQRARPFHDVTH